MKSKKSLELESIVQSGDGVIFLGAGMSADIYPAWLQLISKLCDRCGVQLPEDKINVRTLFAKNVDE